jgi:hypothetical protein
MPLRVAPEAKLASATVAVADAPTQASGSVRARNWSIVCSDTHEFRCGAAGVTPPPPHPVRPLYFLQRRRTRGDLLRYLPNPTPTAARSVAIASAASAALKLPLSPPAACAHRVPILSAAPTAVLTCTPGSSCSYMCARGTSRSSPTCSRSGCWSATPALRPRK